MRPLNRGTHLQRCRGAGRCDCWAAVSGSCQTRGARLCCECTQAGEAPRAGSVSVTLSLRFSPGYKPCCSFLLVLECRVYSVYVHPLQILRLRTIFFCPSCLPQAPWIQRGRKKPIVRNSLCLRACLDLTYSREGSSPVLPCVSRLVFMWKCLWTFTRAQFFLLLFWGFFFFNLRFLLFTHKLLKATEITICLGAFPGLPA